MSDKIAVTIAGAGVVGTAVAAELAQGGREVFVLEANPGVTRGENQSSRNSGVVHAGLYYDQKTRPLKARYCVEGNRLLYQFCRRYNLPALECGKLVVARDQSQHPDLEFYLARARENGVPAELISGEAAREMEPNLAGSGALHLPTSGIVDSTAYLHQLYANASGDGAQFMVETKLVAVEHKPEGLELTIEYRDGARDKFLTGKLINCAGLHADEVARLVNPASPYRTDPIRGEAAKFYRAKRPELRFAGMNLYPCPYKIHTSKGSYFTVGVHLTPTFDRDAAGNPQLGPAVTVGPLSREAAHKEEYGGDFFPMEDFHAKVAGFFPGLRPGDLEPHQVGIQARLVDRADWVIELDPAEPRCLNYLGIDSPGLTASLALGRLAPGFLEKQ